MGAPKNNEFWKLRSKHGRDKIFKTPQLMWEAACEYFTWCENNPLIEIDYKTSMKTIRKIKIPKMRPFTLQGLCLYLHVNTVYFNQFESSLKGKKDDLSKDFSKVLTRIREIIYDQKFTGAASGFFNPSIISRDLGLKDAKDYDHKSSDGSMSPKFNIVVRDENQRKKLNNFLNEDNNKE